MPPRIHYAWVVVAIAFLAVMLPAALRGILSILAVPLETERGWDRAVVSSAAAASMLLFGLLGPFTATLMFRYGARRVMLAGLALVASSMGVALVATAPWTFFLVWGLMVGLGAGILGMVLGNAIILRWFDKGRGIAVGMLGAGIATAQLVIMPPAAMIVRDFGWRTAVLAAGGLALAALAVAARWMRDHPSDVGAFRYGATTPSPEPPAPRASDTLLVLGEASRTRVFWFLAIPFFICGLATGGLIAVHLVPASLEHGVPDVRAATLLSTIGIFDFVGVLLAGWLTDRYHNGKLLAAYYLIRGTSLFFLPMALEAGATSLTWFALVYGLGWVATVPPTSRLAAQAFGPEKGSVVFGWLYAVHQLGAAVAALGAGLARDLTGSYTVAFLVAGVATLVAGILSLALRDGSHGRPAPGRDPAARAEA